MTHPLQINRASIEERDHYLSREKESRHSFRQGLPRRAFLASATMALVGRIFGQESSAPQVIRPPSTKPKSGKQPPRMLDLSILPNFCAHEHWGSIDSIGTVPEGFRADVECGATPRRETDLFDILLDPYFKGLLNSGSASEIAIQTGTNNFRELSKQAPGEALKLLRPSLVQQQFVGTYQCIRRGLLALYDADISSQDTQTLTRLQNSIGKRYSHIFEWYRTAMKKAHFTELIRPVQPEYYVREESSESAHDESAFTHTLMRVDPLLELWPRDSPRRDSLARMTGIEPRDANSWRDFIGKLLSLAGQKKAVGIKQIQAYFRRLEYLPRKDSEVVWIGDLNPEQIIIFQDWVMHECCKQANDRNWVHQIHVGTHNLAQSSPLPLAPLAKRYPRMKMVLIHCWPFLSEAGFLAKYHPNIYLDTCWQLILNPTFFRDAMMLWLNYVPTHKITCSHDATSIEMAVGSSLFTREILAEVLEEQTQHLGISNLNLRRAAQDMLHNNCVEIYGIGKRVEVEESEG